MSVLTLAGKPINWAKPPKVTDKVMWSQRDTSGRKVTGSLWTIAWLDLVDSLAKKKFGVGITVMQPPFNTGVAVSKGTHDRDACLDVKIVGVPWPAQQKFFRTNGAGAYHRTPAQGFIDHIHLFILPPQEGKDRSDDYKMAGFVVGEFIDGGWSLHGRPTGASSQIADYYNHALALKGKHNSGADHSWFPPNIKATIFDLTAYLAKKRGDAPPVTPKPPAPPVAPPVTPTGANTGAKVPLPVHGADISHFQRGVDLDRAKAAGLQWLAHKATQGKSFVDDRYVERRTKARAIGLPFMAYHFAETTSTPAAQAAHFLAVAGIKPGDMPPMLDLEDYPAGGSFFSKMTVAARTAWVGKFVAAVKKATGVLPFIYTPFDLNDDFGCPLWVARYNPHNEPPHVPKPWSAYTIRQFTNGEVGVPKSFPGLPKCDLNCWNSKTPVKMTKVFTIPKPPPVPPEPPVSGNVLVWKGKPRPVDGPILASAPAPQHHWSMKVGDRLSVWETVKANEALDGNLTPGAGRIWFLHSGTAGQCGYDSMVNAAGRTVLMSVAQKSQSLDDWGVEGIKRWRDKNGQHPMTLDEGLIWLVEHHVYGALEVKGPAWGASPHWFQLLHEACLRRGHPAAVKRLGNLAVPKQTVINAHAANVKIAAIWGPKVKGRTVRVARTRDLTKNWGSVKFDATW